MSDSQSEYEYEVETVFLSPSELKNAKFAFDDLLNTRASDGWELDETLHVDSSTFLFIFRRSVDR